MRWQPVLGVAILMLGAAAAALAQTPPGEQPPTVNITVRDAALGDVLAQLSRDLDVQLAAEGEIHDERINIHAAGVTVAEMQETFAELLRHRWRAAGDRQTLARDPAWDQQIQEFRLRRDTQFLERLQELRGALSSRDWRAEIEKALTRAREGQPRHRARTRFSEAHVQQALLLRALEPNAQAELARTGFVGGSLWTAPPASQEFLARFMLANMPASGLRRFGMAPPEPSPPYYGQYVPVTQPAATPRLEFFLLYADRWLGPSLLLRVGVPDAWAASLIPSVLVDLPSPAELYPSAPIRLDDPALLRRLPKEPELAGLGWNEALTGFAREFDLKVASDAYQRPALGRGEGEALPSLLGITLKDALDRLAEHYGMFWWKEDDWFFFRSRHWLDETRVAASERLLRQLGASFASDARLSEADLDALAELSDEQLLTLHLLGSAGPEGAAPLSAFNLAEIQLVQQGLAFWRELTDDQRDLAVGSGVPFYLLNREQQATFAAIAAEHGHALNATVPGSVFFRVQQSYRRQDGRPPTYRGSLGFHFAFGPGGVRVTRLALRGPAPAAGGGGPDR